MKTNKRCQFIRIKISEAGKWCYLCIEDVLKRKNQFSLETTFSSPLFSDPNFYKNIYSSSSWYCRFLNSGRKRKCAADHRSTAIFHKIRTNSIASHLSFQYRAKRTKKPKRSLHGRWFSMIETCSYFHSSATYSSLLRSNDTYTWNKSELEPSLFIFTPFEIIQKKYISWPIDSNREKLENWFRLGRNSRHGTVRTERIVAANIVIPISRIRARRSFQRELSPSFRAGVKEDLQSSFRPP